MDIDLKYQYVNDLRKDLVTMLLDFLRRDKSCDERVRTLKPVTDGSRSPVIIQSPDMVNEFLIYYPRHSTRYTHELDGVRKRCEILTGEIHEATCGRTFTPKDGEFIIDADQAYEPYTLESICIARVIIEPLQP